MAPVEVGWEWNGRVPTDLSQLPHPPRLKAKGKKSLHLAFLTCVYLDSPFKSEWMKSVPKNTLKVRQQTYPEEKTYIQKTQKLSEVANWRMETEIWIYPKENKTQFSFPTLKRKTKQWLEGVGELPAAEEAGKYYKGVHEAEYFVLPRHIWLSIWAAGSADIPTNITSYSASSALLNSCCIWRKTNMPQFQ